MTLTEPAPPTFVAPIDERARIEPLTNEEACLAVICQDESGLELAEFLWTDPSQPHGRWRAYSYQWPWWRDRSQRQVDACARSVGKSERVMARACVFPMAYAGEEMVLIAPEGTHVDNITERIEGKFRNIWLLREMLVGGRTGINHRPFKLSFQNGARMFTRLPQRSGIGVKGIHPAVLEVDEGQDISPATWKELPEVVKWELGDKARWLVHGVSKGVHDRFYEISTNDPKWNVHRITGVHHPRWNRAHKRQQIKEYGGSEDSPDYRRNVLGLHGDAMNRIFNLANLRGCQDDQDLSEYNTEEYFVRSINPDMILDLASGGRRDRGDINFSTDEQANALIDMCMFPEVHTLRYKRFWCGMDVGLLGDPTEILVFAEYIPTTEQRAEDKRLKLAVADKGVSMFKLLTRIKLQMIPAPLQAELVMWIIEFYRPKVFALDGTGIGLPVYQILQQKAGASGIATATPIEYENEVERLADMAAAQRALPAIKSYKFGANHVVWFDHDALDELAKKTGARGYSIDEMIKAAAVMQNAKDRGTDVLRELVDARRVRIPHDLEIIDQFNAQTYRTDRQPVDARGRPRRSYNEAVVHILDAGRMFAMGWAQHPIEELLALRNKPKRPVLDRL